MPSLTSHPRRFSVCGLGPRNGALEGRPIPASAFVTTRNASLDGLYVPEWLGRLGGGECSPSPPIRPQRPGELCDREARGTTLQIGRAHV